jgi:mono/diheme cytochrome c family protein
MKQLPTTLVLASIAGLFAFSCGGEEPTTTENAETTGAETAGTPSTPAEPSTPAAPAVDMAAAKERFVVCAACHGATGAGDGAAAVALVPKPRSFGDKEWQASVTDEHIVKVIVEGGPAVNLSPLMAANADLASKPEVVAGLVQMIREFGK